MMLVFTQPNMQRRRHLEMFPYEMLMQLYWAAVFILSSTQDCIGSRRLVLG